MCVFGFIFVSIYIFVLYLSPVVPCYMIFRVVGYVLKVYILKLISYISKHLKTIMYLGF